MADTATSPACQSQLSVLCIESLLLRMRQERLARRQQERRLAELRAQAGADVRKRLSWAAAAHGMKLDNASCPFCPQPAGVPPSGYYTHYAASSQLALRNRCHSLELLEVKDRCCTCSFSAVSSSSMVFCWCRSCTRREAPGTGTEPQPLLCAGRSYQCACLCAAWVRH